MYEMMKLEEYLFAENKRLKELNRRVSVLSKIREPLEIDIREDIFTLYSRDYSLATNFEIKKWNVMEGERMSMPNGGYYTELHSLYPQFYFIAAPKINVLVQHQGFYDDKNKDIKRFYERRAYGDYSNESKRWEDDINIDKILAFYAKKGVKEYLVEKLRKKINEIKRLT